MELAKAYVQIVPSAKGMQGSIEKEIGGEVGASGAAAGQVFGKNLVGSLVKVVAAVGIGKLVKDAMDEGGALQQSFGGLETIYGDAAEGAKKYAEEAAKAGISMNNYAEQAVSFGASLKQAYAGDTAAAVEAANVAILDMADNAAKMGTPLENIQNAYQGFAKQNYTMLDNLKLGYGGTKAEMQRLLADAEKLSGVHYDMENLGDVYQAIHVIQQELGLTGVAAAEAEGTFTGSMGSMKAAWSNMLASMASGDGATINQSFSMFMQSLNTFIFSNMLPMMQSVLNELPNLLTSGIIQMLYALTEHAPDLVQGGIEVVTSFVQGIGESIPYIIGAALELVNAIVNTLVTTDWVTLISGVVEYIKYGFEEGIANFNFAETATNLMNNLVTGIENGIPLLLNAVLPMLTSFTGYIANNIGKIIDAGVRILKAVVKGIIDSLPVLIAEVPKIIINITRVINENMPKILKAGLDIIVMLGKGIIQNIPVVIANMGNIVKAIIGVVEAINWLNLGSKLIRLFGSGIKALISYPLQFIKDMISSFVDAIVHGRDWSGIGGDIIRGIANGIWNAASAVIDAARSVASNVFGAVAGFFQIGSPSRLMEREIGRWIPAGIAEGIEGNMGVVRGAMADIAEESVGSFDVSAAIPSSDVAPSGGSSINYGGVTINVQAEDVQKSRSFVEWLEGELVARQYSREAAALA